MNQIQAEVHSGGVVAHAETGQRYMPSAPGVTGPRLNADSSRGSEGLN